jgi:hypothetical protein
MNNSESGNWIKLYRQITESKIWEIKPSSWVVIWIYILLKVSFVDNNSYKKGEAHFRGVEHEALPFDITKDIWYDCLQWLEQEGMIKRRKVWRGEVITVLNYERYQNNLSSENCTTGLDPNHNRNIQPNSNEAEREQENDTTETYPNHSRIIIPTNTEEMQSEDPLKNIRIKELNNNIIVSKDTIQGEVDFFLNEKEKEKPIAAGGERPKKAKGNGGHQIYHLVKEFCKEVGLDFKDSFTVKQMGKAASELLSAYTIDEIIEAVRYGKQKYIKEGEDPRQMIPHLQAVVNSISSWRGALQAQKEKEQKKEGSGFGYF